LSVIVLTGNDIEKSPVRHSGESRSLGLFEKEGLPSA